MCFCGTEVDKCVNTPRKLRALWVPRKLKGDKLDYCCHRAYQKNKGMTAFPRDWLRAVFSGEQTEWNRASIEQWAEAQGCCRQLLLHLSTWLHADELQLSTARESRLPWLLTQAALTEEELQGIHWLPICPQEMAAVWKSNLLFGVRTHACPPTSIPLPTPNHSPQLNLPKWSYESISSPKRDEAVNISASSNNPQPLHLT